MSYRKLVIETPDRKNKDYLEIRQKYNKYLKEFHQVYTKLSSKITNSKSVIVNLIGLDGTKKGTYTNKTFNPIKIIKKIKSMPLGNYKPANLGLFIDYKTKPKVSGLGYKDKNKAIETLNKINDYDINYQVNVVSTMLGRAKNHPNQTSGMLDAIKVFENWLKIYHLEKKPKNKKLRKSKSK